jgi:hypothetical protein
MRSGGRILLYKYIVEKMNGCCFADTFWMSFTCGQGWLRMLNHDGSSAPNRVRVLHHESMPPEDFLFFKESLKEYILMHMSGPRLLFRTISCYWRNSRRWNCPYAWLFRDMHVSSCHYTCTNLMSASRPTI